MKYPKSIYKKSADALYMFTIYLKDGDKHHTDYYTLEDAKEMRIILDNDKEVYTISKANMDNNYLDETTL